MTWLFDEVRISIYKYLLNIYCTPGTVIRTKDTERNKADKIFCPNRAYILWERQTINFKSEICHMLVINAKEKTKAEKDVFCSTDSVIPAITGSKS